MRRPSDVLPGRSRAPRGRAGLVVIGLALFFLLTSLRGIASFYTDYLFFEEVNLTSVWSTTLSTKIALSTIFTVAFFALMWTNLFIADRLAPRFRAFGPEDEIVVRYQETVGVFAGRIRVAVAGLFALIAGTGASSQWSNWLLLRNSVPFQIEDPQFGRDISFYVFTLPFLSYLVDWLFVAVVLVLIMTIVADYLNGGIRLQAPVQRVTPQVKAHISVLLGLVALVKGAGYWLQQFELNFSQRGYVDGIGYTDEKAQLPAIQLLMVISGFAFLLFIYNIRMRGWVLPTVAVGLWALVAVLVGAIYPAFVQNFQVKPQENARERPYIAENIKATRAAIGIDDVTTGNFAASDVPDASVLFENASTISNVRLWDPAEAEQTYQALQELKQYYEIGDVDIDRYEIDNELRQTIISVRGLNVDEIPGGSWVNKHLQYTHGYGLVLSSANATDAQGRPDFLIKDIPPVGVPPLDDRSPVTEPRVYFGEQMPGYAVVGTKQPEIDFQAPDGTDKTSSYEGKGGVPIGSMLNRLAFLLRFGDANLVLSSEIGPESRMVFNRDIAERVRAAAPFLHYDRDPYAVLLGGRIVWVQDAYTTTDRYPYGQQVDTAGTGPSGLNHRFNYVRNSVKITIDAYDGTMRFYLFDETDPLARAYEKTFPDLFTPKTEMPVELLKHLRYPEDLFKVQARVYSRYHVTDPDQFYRGNEAWDVAQDPGTGRVSDQLRTTPVPAAPSIGAPVQPTAARVARIDPAYLLLKLPGDERESFSLLQPFVPRSSNDSQRNLTAMLVADSDPGDYGKLRALLMPRGEQVDGPLIVNGRIQADPEVASQLTLLNREGSSATFGQIQAIPIGQSLLWVRPLYVSPEQNRLPELKRVIVVFGDEVVMKPTLREALAEIFGKAPSTLEKAPPEREGETTPPGTGGGAQSGDGRPIPVEVQALLNEAQAAFNAAELARAQGRLGQFESEYLRALELFKRAQRAATAAASPPATTPPVTGSA